ncbi:MAG TPA: cell filamentation protein Fic [Mariprofundaceae bacterium]|nr:cell filamentation protein Fic [Mariprofundaceae bacterium]
MKKPITTHIRNSTAEFLIFTHQAGENTIEVRLQDENIWLTQKLMAQLFQVQVPTVHEHLKNIFSTHEVNEDSVIRKFRITASDGKSYQTKHYNLETVMALGYRINSEQAIAFRQWATSVLKNYTIRGYVLDHERLKNGALFNQQYFDDLIAEIREIRVSERNFYQKITDVYATAMDYDASKKITQDFFATVQNKLHYAIHHHTASELIVARANHNKPAMGLTSWKNSPRGKVLKSDVGIAKNYLHSVEMKSLNRFSTMYLDYAENQAEKGIPMTMNDWSKKLNAFLQFNEYDILQDAGKVSAEIAKSFAHSEFEKFRVLQDKAFESDFDRFAKALESKQ